MSVRVSQNSFARGIISPSLWGRVDLEQYSQCEPVYHFVHIVVV